MDIVTVLFWIAFVITFWFGFRNIIAIITGRSLSGPLKPGQRLCHGISLCIYWVACLLALIYRSFLPFIIGFVIEQLFRRWIIRAGDKAHLPEYNMLLAVQNDSISEIKNLIDQGADVNFHFSRLEGATILHEASRKGRVEILRYLLQNGADVNSKNYNGLTPLHVAAFCGENMVVNALIENGAEVNVKAKDNITPLHSAAVKGNLDTVEVLISNGADVQASSSKDGSTPEDFARREGHQSVVDLLSR
jgi:hypothetical protein